MKPHTPLLLLFVSITLPQFCLAQDIHFTQFEKNSALVAPATTGLLGGNGYQNAYQRAALSYRQQWQSVPVPYSSALFSLERLYENKKIFGKKGSFGAGVAALFDRASDGNLSTYQLQTTAAYHYQIQKNTYISASLQAGAAQRSVETQKLTTNNQFNGDIYDANLPNADPLFAATKPIFYADFGTSVSLQHITNTVRWQFSAAVFHLNEPYTAFAQTSQTRLSRRYTASIVASFPIIKNIDIQPLILFQRQAKYQEIVAGAQINYHLKNDVFNKIDLTAGSRYRLGDALMPTVGLRYNQWLVGLSYDVNTSAFRAATNRDGGFELSVQHLWFRVPKLRNVRACPVF